MSFEIKLPLFEGPFDLLLFFIERDELDIYDIPIATITNDFLSYLTHLEEMNIEVASEFILVASTLMRIKAKMLLPRPVLDEEGNEIDPRDELVRHLLEYKRYKGAVDELVKMENDRLQMKSRGNLSQEIKKLAEVSQVEHELQDVDLYKLLKVYNKVITKYEYEKNKPIHKVVQYPFTISGQKDYILEKVFAGKQVAFVEILEEAREKIAVIFNFLAILELLQARKITIIIGEGFNNFWIHKVDEIEVTS